MRGGIAERGGVRVGHRIIEINGQSVVAVPHERIVNLLATSVGEVISIVGHNGWCVCRLLVFPIQARHQPLWPSQYMYFLKIVVAVY